MSLFSRFRELLGYGDPEEPRSSRKRKAYEQHHRQSKRVQPDVSEEDSDDDTSLADFDDETSEQEAQQSANRKYSSSTGSFTYENFEPYRRPSQHQPSTASGTIRVAGRRDEDWMDENKKRWEDAPNKFAREILKRKGGDVEKAAKEIRNPNIHPGLGLEKDDDEFILASEPEYAFRDVEIRDSLWQILDNIQRFSKDHCAFDFHDTAKLKKAFNKMTPETIKIIGCVASGGPGGYEGWYELFTNESKRRPLVCAIIGNVLVEQVFQHVFFGAGEAEQKELAKIQKKHRNADGFDRNTLYANLISQHLKRDQNTLTLPSGFTAHAHAILEAILTHLLPILDLKATPTSAEEESAIINSLYSIIAWSGILSLIMRADPHTVYYFTPVFKEDTFRYEYAECFNKKEMEATHPRRRESWPADISESEQRRAKGDEPLTQITIFAGLTAYRVGGIETGESSVEKPVYLHEGWARKGIRARILTHGWVYCRWGRARKFVKGKPADEEEVHGAQWREPGFVEFEDVVRGRKRTR
ncbi:hypothetical protein BDV96DRAFT_653618 [Lophiotrema nucula]|uniref:Uncharacterized protein n=1 Tax=Lophiotrema nucula TaxID=690887 RepID=A0A6A5YMS7_9PLEO|nr:hypothetical protein BDV96DRAFT_653618 [Lophiotrema nucula]